jgi:hypothetical protein
MDVRISAYVSTQDKPAHPRTAVANALIRRGAKVIATQGQAKCHYWNMADRSGWVPAAPLEFSTEVEVCRKNQVEVSRSTVTFWQGGHSVDSANDTDSLSLDISERNRSRVVQ